MCKTSPAKCSVVRLPHLCGPASSPSRPLTPSMGLLIRSHPTHPLTINAVSQFTLYAVTRKGTKPDFHRSAPPALARELYEHFVSKVQAGYQAERVRDGVFQAMMDVALVNDGPVCTVVCCVVLVSCDMLHAVVGGKRWLMNSLETEGMRTMWDRGIFGKHCPCSPVIRQTARNAEAMQRMDSQCLLHEFASSPKS